MYKLENFVSNCCKEKVILEKTGSSPRFMCSKCSSWVLGTDSLILQKKVEGYITKCCHSVVLQRMSSMKKVEYVCKKCGKELENWRKDTIVSSARPRFIMGDKVENKTHIYTFLGAKKQYKLGEFKGEVVCERITVKHNAVVQLVVVKLEDGVIDVTYSDWLKKQ